MALEFQINMGGNFSEALEKANANLGKTEGEAHKVAHAMEAVEGELGKVRAGALSLNFSAIAEGGKFFTFDLAEGAALAFEAIKKVGEAVFDLGKEIIKAAAGAEDLSLAIKLDVGDEGAEKVDKLAESFRNTRFDDKDIKKYLLPILEDSGMAHSEQWDDLVTAATDVATRRNTGKAGAQSALEALRSIEIQPQKLRGALKELGIKQVSFYADLGDLLGISAKAAEEQTKAGKVKAQTLLSVALNQIAQREGGALGNATNQGSETLGTALDRLAALKENFFERLAGGEGMEAVKVAINSFVEAFNGPAGARLIHVIDQMFVKLGHMFTVENVTTWTESLISGLETAGKVIGKIVDLVSQAVEIATSLGRAIGPDSALGKFSQLYTGVKPEGGEDKGAGGATFAKTFMAAAGIPAFADGGVVDKPTLALVGEAGPEAIVPLSGGRGAGGGVSIVVGDIVINGAGGSASEIAREVRRELGVFLDEAAAVLGAA